MNFTVQQREQTGKGYNRRLRSQGFTSGVVYGGEKPLLVSMKEDTALRFIKSQKGAKKVVDLVIESSSGNQQRSVIFQDYQMTAMGNHLMHVDFLEVTSDTILSIEVPIHIINDTNCPAIKDGGVIQVIRRSIPVKCSVKDVPEAIVVDLKDLKFGESVHVLDVPYPEGVKPVVHGRNFTLLTVAGRTADEELAPVAAVEGAEADKKETESDSE